MEKCVWEIEIKVPWWYRPLGSAVLYLAKYAVLLFRRHARACQKIVDWDTAAQNRLAQWAYPGFFKETK